MQQPGQTPADTETLQKQADELTRVLETNSWQDYIRLQMEQLETSGKNEAEQQVEKEILQMYLDYDIAPLPNEGRFSYYARNSSDLSWKNDQLNIIRANKLSLLSGELNSNPIDSTTRASLQQQIDVATERLKTDSAPVSATSFVGLMDASTGSISLISLLIIVLAGGLISSEFSSGTIAVGRDHRISGTKFSGAKAILMLEVILMTAGAMFVVSFLSAGCCSPKFEDLAAMQESFAVRPGYQNAVSAVRTVQIRAVSAPGDLLYVTGADALSDNPQKRDCDRGIPAADVRQPDGGAAARRNQL